MSIVDAGPQIRLDEETLNNIKIEKLYAEDVPEYVMLRNQSVNDAPGYSDEEKFRLTIYNDKLYYLTEIPKPNKIFLVAKDRQKIVGILEGEIAHDEQTEKKYGDSLWTGVNRHARKRGVAKALKLSFQNLAKEKGATSVRTFIKDENTASIALNIGMGYQPNPIQQSGGRYYSKPI
jgi:ribosomal protein S18 acetylase RimI-like enzyme